MSKIIHVDKYGGEVCPECEDAKVKNQPPDLTAGEFNRE